MKLLRIESHLYDEEVIDQALVVVPDDYDSDEVLEDVRAWIPEPFIAEIASVTPLEGFSGDYTMYRPFYG